MNTIAESLSFFSPSVILSIEVESSIVLWVILAFKYFLAIEGEKHKVYKQKSITMVLLTLHNKAWRMLQWDVRYNAQV